jgi:hypothetical protein
LKRKKDEQNKKLELLKENFKFNSKVSKTTSEQRKKVHNNRKSKINKGNVGKINGHIGTFSDGVLKLKKSDLKKINFNKKKKF